MRAMRMVAKGKLPDLAEDQQPKSCKFQGRRYFYSGASNHRSWNVHSALIATSTLVLFVHL